MSVNTHWLWNPEDLESTPSIKAAISMEEENSFRRDGVRVIKDIGKAMNLKSNPTLATASVFYHRFYMFHSFGEYPLHMTSLACIFLAGKVEETPKKCKDLLAVAREQYPAKFTAKVTPEDLMLMERVLLQTIRFDLHVEHPYTFLVQYAKGFRLDKDYMSKIVTTAWTFVNDSLGTTLCLMWEPEVIAIALLYMSFKMERMEEQQNGRPHQLDANAEWWNLYVQNLTVPMMDDICHKVLDSLANGEETTMQNGQEICPIESTTNCCELH
uniref:CYCLIN domain-containing protein n=1 Tax=Globodera pallida TaxID=36090 RepID=A0A183BVT2_GLOPA